MYPIYCGHQVIEKRMTDTGDLVVHCVTCHSTNMWNRGSIPSPSFQTPPPKLVGVLKTGLFAVPLEKVIYVPPPDSIDEFIKNNNIGFNFEPVSGLNIIKHQSTQEDFIKNIVRYSLEQRFREIRRS